MKAKVIIPIVIVGALLLAAGGTVLAFGIKNGSQNNPTSQKEHPVGDYSKIKIDIDTADLEFKVSEDSSNKVVVVEKEKRYHTVEVKDDTLTITAVDARKWHERFFDFDWSRLKVTIYAPAKEFASATIKSSTGDIIIPSDYSFQNLNLDLSTGDIDLKSDVKEELAIESSTGDVNLEMEGKKIGVKVSTGKVNLKNVTGEEIKIKSSTGDVKLTDCDASNLIDIETSTGDVNAVLLSGKTFEAKTSTGINDVPPSTAGAPICRIKTNTGDIKVTVK